MKIVTFFRSAREPIKSSPASICLAVLLGLMVCCSTTVASTLPAAEIHENTLCPPYSLPGPGTFSCDLGESVAIASTHGGANPMADVNSHSSDRNFIAGALVRYFFQVTGGTPGDNVPIIVSTKGDASSSGNGGALAQVVVDGINASGFFRDTVTGCSNWDYACDRTSWDLTFNFPFEVGAGFFDSVSLLASTRGGGQAVADPMITIDPTFPNASQYRLQFSPGLASTPEPSSLALVVAGLAGLIGIVSRRVDTKSF